MESGKKKTRAYSANIEVEDFEILGKVLKHTYKELQELLRIYSKVLISIREDQSISFNKLNVKFDLEDEGEFIKFLLNIHYVCKKYEHLFRYYFSDKDEDQNWYYQLREFINALHISNGKEAYVKKKPKKERDPDDLRKYFD